MRSQTWKLSTSGLSAGHQFRGTGFGASEHDGYGINCMCCLCDKNTCTNLSVDLAAPDMIKVGIESKHSCSQTSTKEFQYAMTAALQDMRQLCLEAASPRL